MILRFALLCAMHIFYIYQNLQLMRFIYLSDYGQIETQCVHPYDTDGAYYVHQIEVRGRKVLRPPD